MKKLSDIRILTFVLFILLFSGCIDDPKIDPGVRGAGKPVFNGGAVLKSKTASSIEVTAEILKENGAKITERGFCYGTSPSPARESDVAITAEGVGIGDYTMKIEGLMHNTEYYIRPYAENSQGTEYGTELIVTTNIGTGSVVTLKPQVQEIYASKAIVRGKIEDVGEGDILKRGVYYSGTKDFAVKDSVESADDTEIYLCRLTGLDPSETYYVQAFAVNTYGIFKGGVDSVLTRDGLPQVGEIEDVNAGYTEVTLTSSVTDGGDETVTVIERGFCWALTPAPEISDDTLRCGSGIGGFSGVITNLVAQQLYYARAYAISNFNKIHYSNDVFFSTKTDVPTVRTEEATNIQNGNANVGGVIVDEGMTPITSSGICWSSTNATPTIVDDNVLLLSAGMGGAMSGMLTNLRGGVTYYVCAFATNSNGTSYGEVKHFPSPSIFKTDLEPFPGATRLPNSTASFIIEDMLYLLGGDLGPNYTDELWAYSIDENKWFERQSFIGGTAKWQTGVRYGAGAYIYGGFGDNNEATSGLYYYNVRDNIWEKKNMGADTLYRTAGCAYGGSILYVGGKRDTVKQDVWLFDVVFNLWEKKPDFPVKQYGGIAVALNGVIYAGMGRDDMDVCNGNLWTTSDDATTWTLKTSCTVYNGGILAGVASGQHIYVIDEDYYILEYSLVDDVWTKKSRLPSGYRKIHCMYEYNGKIYIGLGDANVLIVYDPLWDN
ncbi:MAG: hypothetical protein LBG28_05495 [Tannerella sp.]|nr:hypothetical protein [Tannerella sp.]